MMTKLEKHPVADLFPMMSASEFARLKSDIETNGQREDIVVWRGLLIDGRNRLRACEELSIEPQIAELMEETDPVQYALSHNLHRRHLTTAQRAIVAAKLATISRGDVGSGRDLDPSNDGSKQQDAAALLNVSTASLQRAKNVLVNGSAALTNAVESGDVPVSLADRLLKTGCNAKDQAKLVSEGRKAILEFITAKNPPKPRAQAAAVESEVNAELTDEATTENRQAIKSLLSAKNKLVVIDSALKKMSQEELTSLMLRCEELLDKAAQ
jgi:ParB-like chromosome segregation protein Spo0J